MARRNVDLVISAKDEAEKVLSKITAALEEFSNASRGVDGSAGKAESSLGQLGAAIAQLEKDFKGLDIAGKLQKELNDAASALAKLEDAFEGNKAEADKLERAYDQAGKAVERFQGKVAGANTALDRQKAIVAKAKADQKGLSQAYEEAAKSQDKLTQRQSQLPGLIQKQTDAVNRAERSYEKLAAQIDSTDKPTTALVQRFDEAGRRLDTQRSKLAGLTTEYGEIGGKINAAGSAMILFGDQAERATAATAKQETILNKIGQNLAELDGKAGAAEQSQKSLARSLDNTKKNLSSQEQALERAEQGYIELAQSAGKADAALEKIGSESVARLGKELRQQRLEALRAKKAYLDLTQATGQLAVAANAAGVPTREQAEAFARSKVEAAAAKAEYLEQLQALELLGRAFREAGSDINSIQAVQAKFAAILDRTSGALRQNAAAAKAQQAALTGIYGVSERVTAAEVRRAAATERAANASQRGAAATGRFGQALQSFYGDSRRSLSLLQRIRGEVLSLVAAYGGLFGAIEVLRGTVTAYQQLEAVQSRLNVATGGNQERAAQELDFLRRNADRLGISLGVLGTEYSKFSIATKGTNLEGENTRNIFLAVAEAARVNRSSTQEMQGVFTALTQIVSKGAVQMEELRQQLGDRLPGALQLMADGLGVTTAELTKMLEQGEVTADALIPFADELNKRFGPGLADALRSTSASLGRLGNAAFEALVRFGEAGFIEAFGEFAETITEVLKSADFRAFSANASRALGSLVGALGFVIENFQTFLALSAAFIGLKLTPVIIFVKNAMKDLATAAVTGATNIGKTATQAQVATGRFGALGAAIGRTRIALSALLASTGIGLLVAAVGAGVALWATEADKATEAMTTHEQIVNEVRNAYDATAGSAEKWRKQVDAITATEARENLRNLKEGLQEVIEEFNSAEDRQGGSFATRIFGKNLGKGASADFVAEIDKLIQAVNRGDIPLTELVKNIDEIAVKYIDASAENQRYAEELVRSARKVEAFAKSVDEAGVIVDATSDNIEEGQAAFDKLGNKIEEAIDPTKEFADAYGKLEGLTNDLVKDIPKAASATDKAAESAKELRDAYQDALTAARGLPDAIQRAAAEQKVMTSFAEGMKAALLGVEGDIAGQYDQFTSGLEASAAFLRKKEGFRSETYYDVNAERTGFGSDTITRADGTVEKVVKGMVVSIEDANRDLLRRLRTEFMPAVAAAVGEERFNALTPQQQAALTSLAYNYGAGAFQQGESLAGVAAAVRSGSREGVVEAILARANDNEGVNRGRRLEEAALFQTDSGVAAVVKEQEKLAEDQAKFKQDLKDNLETLKQEAAVQSENIIAQETQKALREAELDAKKVGLTLTEEEIAGIKAATAAKFAQKQLDEDAKNAKEAAVQAEQRVNALLAQRRALETQQKLAGKNGNDALQDELEEKIKGVNEQLALAIDNAKKMWEAIGGTAADTAILKLETAAIKGDNLNEVGEKNYLQWERVGDLMVNGLSGAFESFAQAVANGESALSAARTAFLQFASDFLLEIARMIIQQAIFNALQAALGGTGLGNLIGIPAGHTGGFVGSSRVGSGNRTRRVSPAVFAGAQRFHSGGMIGLAPGEVPIIAKQGEEMLTRDDPRHMLNGGGMGGSGKDQKKAMTIINTFDPAEAVERALATPRGQEVLVNAVREKRTEVKAAIG